MTSQIQFVNTKVNDRIEISIIDKLEKLEKRYDWIINARVFLKEEPFKENAMRNKAVEIILSVPGPNIFNKTYAETFEAAVAEGFDDLEVLIRKHKDRMYRSSSPGNKEAEPMV
ncbi:MAG: hypothetical protein RI973_836 [Bacteroidota bacterium]|jgi:putative sigma-54 modulation protein